MHQSETPGVVPNATRRTGPAVGAMLRSWRERRRFSQLALALSAEVSARHVSFLETGRARPSRGMLLRLSEFLEIPHRERNALLLAAGYAPEYHESHLDDAALRTVRGALELLLTSLEPCPALAVDHHWNLVANNSAVGMLMAGIAPELMQPPVNVLRASLHPRGLAPRIANLAQWRAHVLQRLRRDVELTGDAFLIALLEELTRYPGADGPAHESSSFDGTGSGPAVVIPFRLRTEDGILSFVGTTTIFGTAVDVTVAELVIESFLPADAKTKEALQQLARDAAVTS